MEVTATGIDRTDRGRRVGTPGVDRTAGRVCVAGGFAVVAFWACYVSGAIDPGHGDLVVRAFESAFLVADAVLAALLFAASAALLGGRPAGPFLLTAAGAMTLYLGLLDTAFYGLRGLNRPTSVDGAVELAVNLACSVGGAWALRRAWTLGGSGR